EALKGREAAAGRARAAGLEAEVRTCAWAAERVPVLEGAEFEGALWCPSDGVVDIQGLLRGFLEGARAGGAEVWLGCELKAVEVRNGRAAAAETGAGRVETGCLINAAGAWAGPVGEMAGAARLPLRPCRRHLFRTGSLSWAAPDWPLVWDVDDSHYFRPEAGGLLLSACDEEEHPPSLPDVEAAMAEVLREKLRRKVPRLQWLRFEASWACLRTLTPDDRFVVGWDPEVQGFFWAAGLGGHGATCSGALGEMAASLILGRKDPFGLGPSFDPARFLSSG
ncbi:MAG: NAD(P)/FAD-dependent oxidoreductase, partial [Nitrospinota bacterium]